MKARDAINAGVLLAVAGTMVAAVAASLRHGNGGIERERCYGVVRAGANDCANAVHSCAKHATTDSDQREWIAVPRGTCQRIAGGVMDEHTP